MTMMMSTISLLLGMLTVSCSVGLVTPIQLSRSFFFFPHRRFFPMFLVGDRERPPFSGVSSSSFGLAIVTLNRKFNRACLQLEVRGFKPALVHIHEGDSDDNGPVVVDFTPLLQRNGARGCVSIDPNLGFDISEDPSFFYLNVHAGANPPEFFEGVRSQLRESVIQLEFSVSPFPAQEIAPFEGVEGGSAEVELEFNVLSRQVCVEATVEGFDPVLIHLHEGRVGGNGPVVIDMTSRLVQNTANGCVHVAKDLLIQILEDPQNFYVNIHAGDAGTDDFFRGVRAQLMDQQFDVLLEPEQEVGDFSGVEDATGMAALEFKNNGMEICIVAEVRGFSPALLHIHEGAVGTNGGVVVDFTPLIAMAEVERGGSIVVVVGYGDEDGKHVVRKDSDSTSSDSSDDGEEDRGVTLAKEIPVKTTIRGCVMAEPDIVQNILSSPSEFYVNVHQGAEGDGFFMGIRGQLE